MNLENNIPKAFRSFATNTEVVKTTVTRKEAEGYINARTSESPERFAPEEVELLSKPEEIFPPVEMPTQQEAEILKLQQHLHDPAAAVPIEKVKYYRKECLANNLDKPITPKRLDDMMQVNAQIESFKQEGLEKLDIVLSQEQIDKNFPNISVGDTDNNYGMAA